MKKIQIAAAIVISLTSTVLFAQSNFNLEQLKKFEGTNKCSGCDLSSFTFDNYNHSGAVLDGANLSNISANGYPGMNLSNANLMNANLSGATLPYSNFSYANLEGAHFDGAILNGANFYGASNFVAPNTSLCSVIMPDGTVTPPC